MSRAQKPSPSRQRLAALAAACTAWNAKHPAGTKVTYRGDAGLTRTETRSAAEVLNDHSAVIWIATATAEMRVHLDRVKPVDGGTP